MNPGTSRTFLSYTAFYLIFFCILVALHWPVLRLPYFWDELGQFVPAALDIYQLGAWVPKTTLPNVHPPGVMAWLAGVWSVVGYSVLATRLAMLAIAAAGVLAMFLLAIEVCRDLPGAPAFAAPILLLASPLFWSQSVMAQLDMPAMTFTCVALWLFLRDRTLLCALACTVLVLCKETSLPVPLVFGCFLLARHRRTEALLFLLPVLALALWLVVLHSATGHWLGNSEFTHYNIAFQLHPVRMPVTVLRRIWYLFFDNLHVLGTAVILYAFRRSSVFGSGAWKVIAAVALAQTMIVSTLGGAALERYLMPVIPLFYIAVAAALANLRPATRTGLLIAMIVGLFTGILVNSPFAYPFENNAAFVSFVRLQQRAAEYIEAELSEHQVVSAWPFPDALRRPEFGYVRKPLKVRGLDNFDPATVLPLAGEVDVLVVYSRTWEPSWGVLRSPWVRQFLTKYYYYKPQITSEQIRDRLGLTPSGRWEENGQWIEIYVRNRAPNVLVL